MNCDDTNVYDIGYFAANTDNMWTDTRQALEYIADLEEEYGMSAEVSDLSCKWSVVYKFCGITFIMIAANSLLNTLGAFNFQSRQLAGVCGCCLGCLNLASVITTGVFRFRTQGKLASLSEVPNWYDSSANFEGLPLSDSNDYVTDGILLSWIFGWQLSLCCASCCIFGQLLKPPSPEQMMSAHMQNANGGQLNDQLTHY